MVILAAADIHGSLPVYRWLVEQADRADVIVLAGDLLDADFAESQRWCAKKVIDILRTSPIPVLYIMGNDDEIDLDYQDELIQPLHGRKVPIGPYGYNFIGYQYTPPFVGNRFVKEEDEIAKDLIALEPLVDGYTTLVTHAPALGSLDLCWNGNVGSRAIQEFVGTGTAHIHGHIHEQFGVSQNHFNVASAGECRAMLIDPITLMYQVLRPTP